VWLLGGFNMKIFAKLLTLSLIITASASVSAKESAPVFMPIGAQAKADTVSQNSPAKILRKWEYLRVTEKFSDKNKSQGARYYLDFDGKLWGYGDGLDYLGSLGWELVQEVITPGTIDTRTEGFTYSNAPSSHYIFKRELP
jgi:hypothetical protein